MMEKTTTVRSKEYFHDDVCGLEEDNHRIARSFVDVATLAAQNAPVECSVNATGCGSCYVSDAPAAIFWVAQNDAIDEVALKYDSTSEELSRTELGELIVEAAEELGIDVSWNGDPMRTVVLGIENRYVNLDVGTRVKNALPWEEKEGTVINPEWVDVSPSGDGWNIVLFDGEEKPKQIQTKNLELLEDG